MESSRQPPDPSQATDLYEPLGAGCHAGAPFYKLPLSQLIVAHDELDIPFGTVRLKQGGGHGGHNGLRSIMEQLGKGDFTRLRIGIGRPPNGDTTSYVLERSRLPRWRYCLAFWTAVWICWR